MTILSFNKSRALLCLLLMLMMLCLITSPRVQAASKCDSKQVVVTKGEETIWSGATVALFKKYSHGQLGIGNRPEREIVRLSKLIQELKIDKNGQVTISACRNKPLQFAIADIINGEPDIWLVGTSSGEIRIFEYRKGMSKPEKSFKRIMSIHFADK